MHTINIYDAKCYHHHQVTINISVINYNTNMCEKYTCND